MQAERYGQRLTESHHVIVLGPLLPLCPLYWGQLQPQPENSADLEYKPISDDGQMGAATCLCNLGACILAASVEHVHDGWSWGQRGEITALEQRRRGSREAARSSACHNEIRGVRMPLAGS